MLRTITITLFTALLISGCSSIGFPGVYQLSIAQGNIVKQEMLDELGLGMTKRQVRYLMGTPMIKDTFDQDRWDYIFLRQRGDDTTNEEHIFLRFKNDRLIEINGELSATRREREEAEADQAKEIKG